MVPPPPPQPARHQDWHMQVIDPPQQVIDLVTEEEEM
jgi:hypothetical protein